MFVRQRKQGKSQFSRNVIISCHSDSTLTFHSLGRLRNNTASTGEVRPGAGFTELLRLHPKSQEEGPQPRKPQGVSRSLFTDKATKGLEAQRISPTLRGMHHCHERIHGNLPVDGTRGKLQPPRDTTTSQVDTYSLFLSTESKDFQRWMTNTQQQSPSLPCTHTKITMGAHTAATHRDPSKLRC